MMAPFCTRTPPLRAAVGKGGGGVGSKRGGDDGSLLHPHPTSESSGG